MLNRVWNLSPRNEFAEKLCKKTGGAFSNFPRFAAAHCMWVRLALKRKKYSFYTHLIP